MSSAHDQLSTRFAAFEAKGACLSTGDAAAISQAGDGIFVDLQLPTLTRRSKCEARRLKGIGRYETDVLRAYGREKLRPNAGRFAADLAKGAARFLATFNDPSPGDCVSPTALAPPVALDDGRKQLVGKLFDDCGDAVRGPGEQCDALDAPTCPLGCNPDCTCPHCGDGVVNQASEQCDPPTDDACSELCRSDCTCPAPVCGNGIVESGETCEAGAVPLDCVAAGGDCGDPTGPAACRCCIPSGSSSDVGGLCCDGGQAQLQGPHSYHCQNTTGRCDPPSNCELGRCQPDYSCCASLGDACAYDVSFPIPYQAAVQCCAGFGCRRLTSLTGPVIRLDCCVSDGEACAGDGDCCTGHCTGGVCEQCRAEGASCSTAGECCASQCTGGTCAACHAPGGICTDGVQCCSGTCQPRNGPIGNCE